MCDMENKSSRERVAKYRENIRAQGFVAKTAWVHPADVTRYMQFIKTLQQPDLANDNS